MVTENKVLGLQAHLGAMTKIQTKACAVDF
jgi:hypothetical protein